MKLKDAFLDSMQEAMHLLRTAGPMEATAAIQRALRQHSPADGDGTGKRDAKPVAARVVPTAHVVEAMPPAARNGIDPDAAPGLEPAVGQRLRWPWNVSPDGIEDLGHFSLKTFSNHAGQRAYKLYVPASYGNEPMPLIVMLHGCTQDADDFAAGTRMNALADRYGCLVVYPIQSHEANSSKCWNWFRPGDQQNGSGEPALIAGITREVMATHQVDADRVYVAGMSAGGAMAAVMVQRYPELYAAAGIHSGLAHGCAHDLPSALAAMRGGKGTGPSRFNKPCETMPQRPIIVFQGDADHTVHPSNASRLIAPFAAGAARKETEHAGEGAQRAYTRERITAPNGVDAEYWAIHGAPHAWSGGSQRGSFTDAKGPDASEAMMRFFLEHPRRGY